MTQGWGRSGYGLDSRAPKRMFLNVTGRQGLRKRQRKLMKVQSMLGMSGWWVSLG
ncbi:hypothetical protein ABIA45_007906 [Bradyrhizobium sp. USDA 336]